MDKLFEGVSNAPLAAPLQASPPAARLPGGVSSSTTFSLASSPPPQSKAALQSLESLSPTTTTPVSSKAPIRRLPREVIKKGEYGEEYEEWKRQVAEAERRKKEEDLMQLQNAFVAQQKQMQEDARAAAGGATGGGAAGHAQLPPKQKRERRQKKPGDGGNKMKLELVERGQPKRKWFLVKWLVDETQAAEGDKITIFEEVAGGKSAQEVWSLSLTHVKAKGMTHYALPESLKVGRFFGTYSSKGKVLARAPVVLVGPQVVLNAAAKGNVIQCKYAIGAADMSSWDWVGLFSTTQEEDYTNYVTWSYINTAGDSVELELPVMPGSYVCCYFSGAKKYCPVAFSNFVNIADPNRLVVTGKFHPGGQLHVSLDIRSHPRDGSDWVGLYSFSQPRKHRYLCSAPCSDRNSNTVSIDIPASFNEVCPNGFVIRYISMVAAPLTGGAIISSSEPFQIGVPIQTPVKEQLKK